MKESKAVTVDGPPGSGKTTAAKMLAQELGYKFFSAGDHFRAFTLAALNSNVIQDGEVNIGRCTALLANIDITTNGVGAYYLNGDEIPTRDLHAAPATDNVSIIGGTQAVRDWHDNYMHQYAAEHNGRVVFEGRLTWEEFPEAFHVALEVDPVEAHRRVSGGRSAEVAALNKTRHEQDHKRTVGTIKEAPDAFKIDTTKLTPEEVVKEILLALRHGS